MQPSTPEVKWSDIDTVLLDMDGTLLDLAFDNFFWLELVPSRYAQLQGLSETEARQETARRYAAVAGSLRWYCIEHWSRELGLDIRALKWSHRHLIRYLPMVPEFLDAVRRRGKRLILVTNAHRETLAVKTAQTGLDGHVDEMISSHDYGEPKESHAFWETLHRRERFDPKRSMFVEDSLAVLNAARQYGLEHMVAIRCPDSGRPAQTVADFPAVDGVADLI